MVEPEGLEPSQGNYPTSTSSLRVYQFHHGSGILVDKGGVEPPVFLMSQIYSLLPSPLGTLVHKCLIFKGKFEQSTGVEPVTQI